VQIPVPWIDLHEALAGHVAPLAQIRAQLVGVWEPLSSRTHSGVAEVPVGAAGQSDVFLQTGEQKLPLRPVTCTGFSPFGQVPAFGSAHGLVPGGAGGGGGPGGPGGPGGAGGPLVMMKELLAEA